MALDYLIEIGTEELPHGFINSAIQQMKEFFEKILEENQIGFDTVKTYSTPRRLALIVENISESQLDSDLEVKGPPANIGFDSDGNLTQAGIGFAKKQGISLDLISKKDFSGTEYLFAKIKKQGVKTEELISKIVPEILFKLQGTRFMRWADLEIKFSRPVRWIVSLLGENELKIEIGGVISSRYSRGLRYSGNDSVEIKNPDSYLETLYNAKVIADCEKRKQTIENLIKQSTKSITENGTPESSASYGVKYDELLDEVCNLVEWATPVIGSFDEKYLKVTNDVITCVLAHHQRYFPVFDKDGNLLNRFITIANHDDSNLENIRKGNEKVVKPRLDDAIFFYGEDVKKSFDSRVEELKGVTFQKGLGTVYDKTLRIQEISGFIAGKLELSPEMAEKIKRTAFLCKADLVTNLVREFTELQGIIGGDYARINGEDALVSQGIREHYLPDSGVALKYANSVTGQIVGIADKIDTICGVFAMGKAPTGSTDPLGLRRAALGIIDTIITKNININLSELIEKSLSIQPISIYSPESKQKMLYNIREFIIQRLSVMMEMRKNFRQDIIEACIYSKDPLDNIPDLVQRIKTVEELVKKDFYRQFHESANRVHRILKTEKTGMPEKAEDSNFCVCAELFKDQAENELWEKICAIEAAVKEASGYEMLVEKLHESIPSIEKFFERVLVMDNNEKVRQNRINLLENLKCKFLCLSDFTKVVFS